MKQKNTTLDQSKVMFANSHKDIVELAETFSNDELFSKDVFDWVGGSTLGAYFVSATASHYDWAIKTEGPQEEITINLFPYSNSMVPGGFEVQS